MKQTLLNKMGLIVMIAGLAAIFLFCFILHHSHLPKTFTPENTYEDTPLVWAIDLKDYTREMVRISGWAFIPGEDIDSFKCHVILRNPENDSYVQLNTFMQLRPDITALYNQENTEYSYDASGFCAYSPLAGDGTVYDVYLLYENNNHSVLVNTGQSINAVEVTQ